jgi:tRNA modification GTPase
MDTIFALSSKFGKAGVAVFRISGNLSLFALKQLVREDINPTHKLMYYKKIYDPSNEELIDHAMIVYFKAPNSFTGEDIVEIHTHGSVAIIKMLNATLLNIRGLRLAEPGEFARRAVLNNKFDLTAAEGLADLIEAETIEQHKQAIRQASGELEKLYDNWREKLLTVISLLEAYIDFPEEEIPEEILENILSISIELKNSISSHLNDNRRGELLRSGIKLAIIGPPNVGKSSLLNFFMQREVAIVSNIAGTTRDIVEAHLDIGGYPIILQDSAGIRTETTDRIEQEGIRRSIETAKQADIRILMFDVDSLDQYQTCDIGIRDNTKNTILVINKIDQNPNQAYGSINDCKPILISVKEQLGLDLLINEIKHKASNIAGLSQSPSITRERHRYELMKALEHLSLFDLNDDLVLATENIRMCIRALSHITGKITVEEILGEIFSKFCIGK